MKTPILSYILMIFALLPRLIGSGLAAETAPAEAKSGDFSGKLSLTIGGYDVNGDSELFTEHRWRNDDVVGGIDEFVYEKGRLRLDGRVIFNERDYALRLTLAPREHVFLRAGVENYRKYFDDTGGYDRGNSYSLGRDLFLDIGKAWAEIDLDFEDLPDARIGYEYRYKEGAKSYLEWNRTGAPGAKQICPATKDIDEQVHVLKLDVDHDLGGLVIGDQFRFETFDGDTSRSDLVPAGLFTPVKANDQGHLVDQEDLTYEQLSNALTLEKWLTEKVFVSAGYLLIRHDSRADFAMRYTPENNTGAPLAYSGNAKFYLADDLELDQDSHVVSVGALLLPNPLLSLSLGFQVEDTKTRSDGPENLRHGNPPTNDFVEVDSTMDTIVLERNAEIRFTGLPLSTIYAQASFWEDDYHQTEERLDNAGVREFYRDTETDNDERQYRVGLSISPFARLFLNTYYQRSLKHNNYDHDGLVAAGASDLGYKVGFIDDLDHETHEYGVRLTYRLTTWLNTGLRVRLIGTAADNTTEFVNAASPGGNASTMDYQAQVYSFNATFTPVPRFYLSTIFSQQNTRTKIPAINAPNLLDDYQGDVYTLLTSARYVASDATDVSVGFYYSSTDNRQHNIAALPQASDYNNHSWNLLLNHRFTETLSGNLRYEFYRYSDSYYAHAADYTAHGIFGGLTQKF